MHTADKPGSSRRQPLDSLATKIILFVFLSTFATALVVSWISLQSTHDHLSRQLDRQFPSALTHARDELTAWFEAQVAPLAKLGSEPLAASDLGRVVAASELIDGLALFDSEGVANRLGGRDARVELARVRPEFDPTSAGLHTGLTPSGERIDYFTHPRVGAAEGEFLVAVLNPDAIDAAVSGQQLEFGQSLLLVDARGTVLFGPRDHPDRISLAPLTEAATSAVREYTNGFGVRVVGSAVPFGLANWHLIAEAPFDVVFDPVVSVVKRIFVIDLCIILLFSFLAYKITAAILRPIEILSDGARRIAQGQLDHEIPEPSTNDEIGLLTHTFNDMMRKLRGNQGEIEFANAKLRDQNLQLQQANEILEQLSITDGLTKLHNHRFFQDHLTREIKRVNRVREPLSMILVDVDDFKSLNDRLGHASGDELLRRIAMLMNDSIRESDLLARYGGDEFVILASDTDLAGARQLAEKIRTSIAETSFIVDESLRPIRTTLSMGVAQYSGTRKRFFAAADAALYRAKAQGKDCVAVDEEDEIL